VHAEPSYWLHEIWISKTVLSPFSAWANTPIIYKLRVLSYCLLLVLWLATTPLVRVFDKCFWPTRPNPPTNWQLGNCPSLALRVFGQMFFCPGRPDPPTTGKIGKLF
jgi:hypothetical protein